MTLASMRGLGERRRGSSGGPCPRVLRTSQDDWKHAQDPGDDVPRFLGKQAPRQGARQVPQGAGCCYHLARETNALSKAHSKRSDAGAGNHRRHERLGSTSRLSGPLTGASGRITRADWVSIGALLVVTIGIFWQGLFDRVGMIREDAAYQYQCFYEFAGAEVRQGRFPHWNPFSTCGIPFHATLMGALLYPLRWPLFWMSWPWAYPLSLWVHYFLTGVFTYAFIRIRLRCGPVPSLIGAISFAFGGFTMGHLTHPNYFQGYPWCVLTILLVTQAVERRDWVWAVAASIPVGLMGMIGAVHLLLILAFGMGVWALGEVVAGVIARIRSGRTDLRNAFWPMWANAIAFPLGAALSAAQLLPAFQQMGLSTRTETGWDFVTEISAHPLRVVVRLVAPFYWGNYRLGYWGENSFHEHAFYTGLVTLSAAVLAVVLHRRDRWVIRLAVLCAVAAVVAAGRYLPVFWVLYRFVPMFDRLRDPARLLWLLQFGVACLAAIGLQRIGEHDSATGRRAVVTSLVTSLLFVGLIAACLLRLGLLADDPTPAMDDVQKLDHLTPSDRAQHLMAAQRMPSFVMQGDGVTWLGIVAAVLSCCAISACVIARRKLTWPVGSVLAGLLVLDLGMFSGGMFNYTQMDHAVVDTPDYVRYLQHHLGAQRYLCLAGRDADAALNRGMLFRIRHAIAGGVGINHTPRQERMIGLLWSALRSGTMRLANLAGVRYFVADRPIKTATITPVFQGVHGVVSENSQAMPRAFLTRQTQTISDPNALLIEILKGTSDLSDVAFLEEPADSLPTTQAADVPRGEVLDLKADVSRYTMRVRAPAPRQLVLTETYHPEWQCTVDGNPVRVQLTDWTFMSVRVPAGEHNVEWRYEPARFRMGLRITVVTLFLVVGVCSAAHMRGRRQSARS